MVFQKEFVMLTSTPLRSKPRSKLNDSDIQAIPDEKGRIVRKSKYHPDKTRELLTLDESDEEKEEVSLPGIPSFSMNSSNGENMGNSSFIESYDLGNKASKRPRILETSSSSEDTQDENSIQSVIIENNQNELESAQLKLAVRQVNKQTEQKYKQIIFFQEFQFHEKFLFISRMHAWLKMEIAFKV